jgi:hypothetical protein
MKQNVGTADKIVRVVIGIAIIILGIYFKSWWGIIGVIPLISAALGWCPLYIPLKISTTKEETGK